MTEPNKYRCETCRKYPAGSIFDGDCPQCWILPYKWDVPIDIWAAITSMIGCALHSDFQSEREQVLDELIRDITIKIKDNERFEGESYTEMLRNGDRRYLLKKYESLRTQGSRKQGEQHCNDPKVVSSKESES